MALVFPGGSDGKESACSADAQVQALGWEDPLEKEMATHFSILAWMEESGRLQSMGSQKSRTRLSILMTRRSPFMRLHPHDLIASKAPLPNTIVLEVRL